jgi:hypothetical protein
MTITKSEKYKVGICGIRAMLDGDKEKAMKFEEGLPIDVTDEQYERISKLGWCDKQEVNDGN